MKTDMPPPQGRAATRNWLCLASESNKRRDGDKEQASAQRREGAREEAGWSRMRMRGPLESRSWFLGVVPQ